jgi:hypothetical protein
MKKINILMIIIIIILLVVVSWLAVDFFILKKRIININANINQPPAKTPIVFTEYDWDLNNLISLNDPVITEKYKAVLYLSIGLNEIMECDNNKNLIPFEDQSPQRPNAPYHRNAVSETCRNQYNSFQYLKTGNADNLDAITTENTRKTAQAIRENNPDLCPGMENPTCLLTFQKSCIDKNYLAKDDPWSEKLRRSVFEYLIFINPQLEDGYDFENDAVNKDYVIEAYDFYEEYLCDLLFKQTKVKVKAMIGELDTSYCSQFNKDKNLLERLFYFRCMNFAQDKINYSLDELKSLYEKNNQGI